MVLKIQSFRLMRKWQLVCIGFAHMQPLRHTPTPLEVSQPAAVSGYDRTDFRFGPRPLRSRQMVFLLRQEFIYSEKRARDILFYEMELILDRDRSPGVTIARLTREAAAAGRRRAASLNNELANWETAAKATVNAMLGARVLLGAAGVPIMISIAAPAAEVGVLADAYQDRTEAFLLEFLIRRMGDVTARDYTALAHALLRQFDRTVPMEELEDRIAYLLSMLTDRIAVGPGGIYCAADSN
jgi:hypothetical protein